MGTVVIELEGMLSFGEHDSGFCHASISIGAGESLDVVIAEHLDLALDGFVEAGHCKLRLEIERP